MSNIEAIRFRAYKSAGRMEALIKLKAPKDVIKNELELLKEHVKALLDALDASQN